MDVQTEIRAFDEYFGEQFPSKHNPLFIASGFRFVVEYLLDEVQTRLPTLWRTVNILVRNEGGLKDLKVLGIIASILGAWKKQQRFLQKFFHVVMIASGANSPIFRVLNQFLPLCYWNKLSQPIKDFAENRIHAGKQILTTQFLRIGGDNCSKTNMWSNPPGQQVHSVTTGFHTEPLDFVFDGNVFHDREIKVEEMTDSVTQTQLLALLQQGRLYFDSYIQKRKERYLRAFRPMCHEFFALIQFLVDQYSVDEISKYFSGLFNQFHFADMLRTLIAFHADFQFYNVSCRKWNPKKNVRNILCLLGALHYEMSIADCLWKTFGHFFLFFVNQIMKCKCPDKFSSSKYPRFKKLLILTILSVKKIIRKVGVQFGDLGSISNYQLKVLLVFDYLGNLYGSYLTNVRNNNFVEVLRLYDVFQGLFWVLHKTNYNIGNFEQRIHFKLIVGSVFNWMKKHRFISFRFDDSHIGYDQWIEIMNCIIKNDIQITGHDPESLTQWSELVPLLFYLICNERKEFVSYCRNKRRSSQIEKKRKKWVIEKQVERVTDLIWKYLTRKWDGKQFTVKDLLSHKCPHALFCFEKMRTDPLKIFEQYGNYQKTEKWRKWCSKNVSAFNCNGTCFVAPEKSPRTELSCKLNEDEDNVAPSLLDELFDREEYIRQIEEDQEYEDSDDEDEEEIDDDE